MYGWRARIGLIIPANNVVIEPEFYKMMPEGVCVFSARIMGSSGISNARGFQNLMKNTERGIQELLMAEVDILVYSCFSTSLINKEWNGEFEDIVKKYASLPCFTAYSATVEAIQRLELNNISAYSAFTDEFDKRLIQRFEEEKIRIRSSVHLNIADSRKIGSIHPETLYRTVKNSHWAGSEGIVIFATDIRSYEVIGWLEKELDLPVISTNQAILCKTLNALSIKPDKDIGSLF